MNWSLAPSEVILTQIFKHLISRQKDQKTNRQKDKRTKRQKDKRTKGQKDKKQKDTKTHRL